MTTSAWDNAAAWEAIRIAKQVQADVNAETSRLTELRLLANGWCGVEWPADAANLRAAMSVERNAPSATRQRARAITDRLAAGLRAARSSTTKEGA